MLLPAAVLLFGLVASLFFERPQHAGYGGPVAAPAQRTVPAAPETA